MTQTFVSQQYGNEPLSDAEKQQKKKMELEAIWMVLKSLSEMTDVKHPNNVFQTFAFDSVL